MYGCPLFWKIETFLIFQVFFIERFITPSASVAPASSASVASTAFHGRRSFGLHCPLHNRIAVFVEEVHSLLAVLWVLVVPDGEIILYIHF